MWWSAEMLAVVDPFQAVRAYLQHDGQEVAWVYLAALVVALCVLGGGLSLLERLRHPETAPVFTADTLFHELCAAHHLTANQEHLLRAAAPQVPSDSPCLLFLDPRLLTTLAQSDQPHAAEYADLLRRLFGQTAAVSTSKGPAEAVLSH